MKHRRQPSLNRHGNIVPLGPMLAVFDKK